MTEQTDPARRVRDAAEAIDAALPLMAQGVIRRYLDLNDPANMRFLDQPDDRGQHQTRWHQWGIITHTRTFLQHYEVDVPHYLDRWGVRAAVAAVLSRTIDGASRADLLRISILLHDIGKFAARTHGRGSFHFARHERLSGSIVRADLDLAQYGLTPDQIEYIALTAQDHFVLGVVRQRARQTGDFTPAFVESDEFRHIALTVKSEHPEDFVEIGILFLGDSLSKVNPPEGPEPALSQYTINLEVARRYLQIVLGVEPAATTV